MHKRRARHKTALRVALNCSLRTCIARFHCTDARSSFRSDVLPDVQATVLGANSPLPFRLIRSLPHTLRSGAHARVLQPCSLVGPWGPTLVLRPRSSKSDERSQTPRATTPQRHRSVLQGDCASRSTSGMLYASFIVAHLDYLS